MTVIDRRPTEYGELVLRREGADFEIIVDGSFLMDTRNGESERLLVTAALAAAPHTRSALIGGLGVGFSVEAALDHDALERVTVVEVHQAVIDWNSEHFGARMGHRLADPRLSVLCADLPDWLRRTDERFDVVCLDVDNGPDWLAIPTNGALYTAAGLALLAGRLTPSGVLAVWSAARAPVLEDRLRTRFATVTSLEVAVPRGEPDMIYIATDDGS